MFNEAHHSMGEPVVMVGRFSVILWCAKILCCVAFQILVSMHCCVISESSLAVVLCDATNAAARLLRLLRICLLCQCLDVHA